MQGAGETGVAGRTVYLDQDGNGTLTYGERSVVTDADGNFTFANLAPGAYTVAERVPYGYIATHRVRDRDGHRWWIRHRVTGRICPGLGSSEPCSRTTTAMACSTPGKRRWAAGQCTLDLDGSGTLSAGEPQTVTNASGYFSFGRLGPGSYTVREVTPAGAVASPVSPVILTSGQAGTVTVGEYLPGTLTGTLFGDTDGNGAQAAGETGVAGRTVYLDQDGNGALTYGERTAVTDAHGDFSFANLAPGAYTVAERVPYGYIATTLSVTATVTPGGAGTASLGEFAWAGITGYLVSDNNGDGVVNSGEGPLGGRTVYLDLDGSGTLTAGEPQAVTRANGYFTFGKLGPGPYTVREVVSDNAHVSSPIVVSLRSGQAATIKVTELPRAAAHAVCRIARGDSGADRPRQKVHGVCRGRYWFAPGLADRRGNDHHQPAERPYPNKAAHVSRRRGGPPL